MATVTQFENIKIEGLKELADACRELGPRIGRNVLRGAVGAGAAVIRNEAKQRAPVYSGPDRSVEPGVLKKAIYQKQIRELSSELEQTFYVGVRHGSRSKVDAYYWRFVEFGHLARNGKPVAAHPFMRPAFEAQKDAALLAIVTYLEVRIPAEVVALPK